jgi:molybdopterin-synthase adenylyltransferase
MGMSNDDRYSRQTMFNEIGKEGQRIIGNSSAAIVGVGALGSTSADMLARAGVGKLIIIDNDIVDESNLQRQSLYDEDDVSKYKIDALKKHLLKINSKLNIEAIAQRLTAGNIDKIKADVIIDGTDNMETRFLLNEYSKKTKTPYIYGAAAGAVGIVFNVMPDGPCLACVFSKAKNFASCDNQGIISPATHIVSSIQVSEALKILLKKEPCKEIMRFDVWKNSFEDYKVAKNEKCSVCKGEYSCLLKKDQEPFTVSECRTKSAYTAKPNKKMHLNMKKITAKFETIEDAGIIAVIKIEGEEIIVHDYGELLFKTLTDIGKIKTIVKEIYNAGKI